MDMFSALTASGTSFHWQAPANQDADTSAIRIARDAMVLEARSREGISFKAGQIGPTKKTDCHSLIIKNLQEAGFVTSVDPTVFHCIPRNEWPGFPTTLPLSSNLARKTLSIARRHIHRTFLQKAVSQQGAAGSGTVWCHGTAGTWPPTKYGALGPGHRADVASTSRSSNR